MTAMRPARSGFTLIEMITVIVILGVLGVGTALTLVNSVDTYTAVIREAELATETWSAVERVARELRHAATPPILPAPGSSSDVLSFMRPSAADCAACVDKSTSVTFSAGSGNLWRESGASGRRILADRVLSFTVTAGVEPPGARIYTISLTRAQDGAAGADGAVTVQTSVSPPAARNPAWIEVVQ